MSALNQNLPDELLNKFNQSARKKFGDKKGSKRTALIEAMREWTIRQKR